MREPTKTYKLRMHSRLRKSGIVTGCNNNNFGDHIKQMINLKLFRPDF